MVKIARHYVNNTTNVWVNSLRAALNAASHNVSTTIAFDISSLLARVASARSLCASLYCLNNKAQLMQTMTSMMIIMPSRGGR